MIPCTYRGEIWRNAISCLCGYRGQEVPVYYCSLHVICTYRPYSHTQSEMVCLRCPDAKEVDRDSQKPCPT
jgi:hypothetical protein